MLQPKDLVATLVLGLSRPKDGHLSIAALAGLLNRQASPVHKSLQQSVEARLVSRSGATSNASVMYTARREAVREFVQHGVRYVYACRLLPRVRGIATAWSAPPLCDHINSTAATLVVWPDSSGDARGEGIEPLHASALFAARRNPVVYAAFALIDAIRVGQARERRIATELFSSLIDEHMR